MRVLAKCVCAPVVLGPIYFRGKPAKNVRAVYMPFIWRRYNDRNSSLKSEMMKYLSLAVDEPWTVRYSYAFSKSNYLEIISLALFEP